MLTYVQVSSGVTADDNLQALQHLWQCLVFFTSAVPYRVVKMHRRSLCSSFLGNYRAAHSFSLRVAMARAIVFMGVFAPRGPRREIFDFGMGQTSSKYRRLVQWDKVAPVQRRSNTLFPTPVPCGSQELSEGADVFVVTLNEVFCKDRHFIVLFLHLIDTFLQTDYPCFVAFDEFARKI